MFKISPFKKPRSRIGALGFTLIELAIVLGVAGVLFGGLWRLMSGGNQQLRDQSAASSQVQIINAVKAFLASPEGQAFMTANNTGCGNVNCPVTSPPTSFYLPLPSVGAGTPNCSTDTNLAGMNAATPGSPNASTKWCQLLPPGFSTATANSYGQTFDTVSGTTGLHGIRILRDSTVAGTAPVTYSFTVATLGGDIIPDSSGGRISASIGGDGGFIYANSVCDAQTGTGTPLKSGCGSYGTWAVDITTYGYGAAPNGGYVFSRTYVAPEQSAGLNWLARNHITGDNSFTYNTMSTALYLNNQDLNMGPYAATPPTTGATNINMAGAKLNMQSSGGSINMAGSPLNMNGGSIVVGGGPGGITMNNAPIDMGGGTFNLNAGTINLANGTISGLATTNGVRFSGDTSGATANPILKILDNAATFCADPTFAACQASLHVQGTLNVTDILNAKSLYAQGFLYQSDRRLKKNIEPLSPLDSLEKVLKLQPVSFTFKSDNTDSLGVIAQDIEKIYPVLVTKGDGMKSVNYMGIVAPLIGAVQELKKENDELRQQLTTQQERLEKLEATRSKDK